MDSHLLIAEVFKREALWKRKHVYHHHRGVLERLWREVAEVVGTDISEARRKWKNLKDHYRTELRKVQVKHKNDFGTPYKSYWAFYKNMSFLKKEMLPGMTSDLKSPPEIKIRDSESSEDEGPYKPKSVQCVPPGIDSEDADNYYFFMSLLPHIRHLDTIRLMRFRNKVQELVIDGSIEQQEYVNNCLDTADDTVDVKPHVIE